MLDMYIYKSKYDNITACPVIRSGSSNQIITAAGDGAIAAISAQRLLEGLE